MMQCGGVGHGIPNGFATHLLTPRQCAHPKIPIVAIIVGAIQPKGSATWRQEPYDCLGPHELDPHRPTPSGDTACPEDDKMRGRPSGKPPAASGHRLHMHFKTPHLHRHLRRGTLLPRPTSDRAEAPYRGLDAMTECGMVASYRVCSDADRGAHQWDGRAGAIRSSLTLASRWLLGRWRLKENPINLGCCAARRLRRHLA